MNSYEDQMDDQHLSALWKVMSNLITPQPTSSCQAHLWRYDDIRPTLFKAGEIISAKEAVRRVLILENPGMKGQSKITTSLYGGLQLVLPGEVAPAHRHSQSALRFILEGNGAHTTVDGERTNMSPGDFVITPSMAWHDHGNTTDEPMVWLDGLDIPIVQFLDASFLEEFGQDEQPVTKSPHSSRARYGQGLLPVDTRHNGFSSPVFNYTYESSRKALEILGKEHDWDACHGIKLHYANPLDGGYTMPTIATFLQMLPKGFSSEPYRSTDATVFVCVEGSGSSTIAGRTYNWSPHDIFVVPSWQNVLHKTSIDSILFSFSDRAVQEKLGLWREKRG